jgi:hypothetical protein
MRSSITFTVALMQSCSSFFWPAVEARGRRRGAWPAIFSGALARNQLVTDEELCQAFVEEGRGVFLQGESRK